MPGRRIECFMIEPTGMVLQRLRRFCLDDNNRCPGPYSYHNGHAPLDKIPAVYKDGCLSSIPNGPPKDDPRWPSKCDHCPYTFNDGDQWQVFQDILYHRPGVVEEFTLENAPVGSIWECDWYPAKWRGPDGKCICIKTPDGDWMPDMPSKQGTPWQRTGKLPKITVRPSILFNSRRGSPGYHGWLTDGFLIDC